MKIEIRILDTVYEKELQHALHLLNKSQRNFVVELGPTAISLIGDQLDTDEIEQLAKQEGKAHAGLVLYITDRYLYSKDYSNLFGMLFTDSSIPNGYAVCTTFGLMDLLEVEILELYFMASIMRNASMFFAQQYLSHFEEEKNYCLFDYLVDKVAINTLLKTGNICLDCQIQMDQHLSLTEIFSLNKVARIIGRITRAADPQQLFGDYLTLIEKNESDRELVHVESTISQLSRMQGQQQTVDRTELEALITAGDIIEALQHILSDLAPGEERDRFILLYSRYNALEEDIHEGVATFNEANTERNKITKALLYFLRSG